MQDTVATINRVFQADGEGGEALVYVLGETTFQVALDRVAEGSHPEQVMADVLAEAVLARVEMTGGFGV